MRTHFFNAPALKTLAIVAALSTAPVAFAQDASTTSWTQRFNATIGYAQSIPKSDPGTVAGSDAHMDGSGAATLSGSWFFNDNWAIELWGTPDKFEQKVSLANGGRGTVKEQPIALSGQYFFGHASQPTVRTWAWVITRRTSTTRASIRRSPAASTWASARRTARSRPSAPTSTSMTAGSRALMRATCGALPTSASRARAPANRCSWNPWVVGVGVGARF